MNIRGICERMLDQKVSKPCVLSKVNLSYEKLLNTSEFLANCKGYQKCYD